MSTENNQSSKRPEGFSSIIAGVLTLLVVALACGVAVFSSHTPVHQSLDSASYTVAGKVAYIGEDCLTHANSPSYHIVIATDEPISNGTCQYESWALADYLKVREHLGDRVLVTLGSNGRIKAIDEISAGPADSHSVSAYEI